LRDSLSEALFIAICAEIRHITDKKQNYEDYKNDLLLKNYLRNYGMFSDDSLPDEFKPTRNMDKPQQQPASGGYLNSFKAATKAIKDTGSSREQFARLCADLFKNMKWPAMYGGKKWAEIANAYVLLNKTPQTNAQLQVAIDHAYDLQHNTGTVLNKVKTYYNNGDISWLKKALDFKANLKNVYELLPKCSSDMRKLALEAFKTAGIKKNTLEKTVAGDSISGNKGSDTSEIKTGDSVRFKSNDGNLEIEGIAKEVNRHTVWITITKVIKATSQADAETYKLGSKHGFGSKFVTKINNNDLKLKIGDAVIFKNSEAEIEGVITKMINSSSNIKVTKVIDTIAQQKDLWIVGTTVQVNTSYLTKKSNTASSNKSKQFGVGDFIRYKAGTVDNVIDIFGIITTVDATDEKSSIVTISKINSLPQSPWMVASRWKIGQKVLVYNAYMTKIGEKTTFDDDKVLKIGDVGTMVFNFGNVYEVKILNQAGENSYNILVLKGIDIKYKNDGVRIGRRLIVGTTFLKTNFKSYNETSSGIINKGKINIGDTVTVRLYQNLYECLVVDKVTPDTAKIEIKKILKVVSPYMMYRVGAIVTMNQMHLKKV